ncbi:MAG: hypothetical protein AAGD14_17610, partial [Planctomycetota bacterium]
VRDLRVVIETATWLRLLVENDRGEPVEAIAIQLDSPFPRAYSDGTHPISMPHLIEMPPTARLGVHVYAPGYRRVSRTIDPWRSTAGITDLRIRLEPAPAGLVALDVTHAVGRPPARVHVEELDGDGRPRIRHTSGALVRLADLDLHPVRLRIWDPEHPLLRRTVAVTPRLDRATPTKVRLPRGIRLAIRLPPEDHQLHARVYLPDSEQMAHAIRDRKGVVQPPALPPGTYRLVAVRGNEILRDILYELGTREAVELDWTDLAGR